MGRRFWQQSERDLEAARRLLQPGTYFAAASFAHQAAEKALKAAHWHLRAEEPPWRHDLDVTLRRLAERAVVVPSDVIAAIDGLRPIFEESRYPSGDVSDPIPADLITEGTARRSVELAEEVMTWVRDLLQQPPGRPRPPTTC
jgi:HEPN domain-containing protein